MNGEKLILIPPAVIGRTEDSEKVYIHIESPTQHT